MRLATQFALATSCTFAAVLAIASVVLAVEEVDFVDEEIVLHGRLLGDVVAAAAQETWQARGEAAAQMLVSEIDRREPTISVRWTSVDDAKVARRLSGTQLQSLRDGEVIGHVSPVDEAVLLTYASIGRPKTNPVIIEVAESLEARNDHVQALLLRIVAGAIIGFVLSALSAYVLGKRLIDAPLASLIAHARRIGRGELSRPVEPDRNGEIGVLAREMDEMRIGLVAARGRAEKEQQARREAEEHLRQAERLAMVGELAAGLAHEIGTPLQSITARAELVRQLASDRDGVKECADGIEKQAGRVADLVRDLLGYARRPAPKPRPTDLRAVVASAVDVVAAVAPDNVEIVVHDAEPSAAEVDPDQIERVLTNLMLNGIHAMPDGGRLELGLSRVEKTIGEAPPRDFICVVVEDEGTGIPEEVMQHLFEPFFTTKGLGKGTGLGLPIAHNVVSAHGGTIEVRSVVNEGSAFSVFLPVVSADADRSSAPSRCMVGA